MEKKPSLLEGQCYFIHTDVKNRAFNLLSFPKAFFFYIYFLNLIKIVTRCLILLFFLSWIHDVSNLLLVCSSLVWNVIFIYTDVNHLHTYVQNWYGKLSNLLILEIAVNLTLQIGWERWLFHSPLKGQLGQCTSKGWTHQNAEPRAVSSTRH